MEPQPPHPPPAPGRQPQGLGVRLGARVIDFLIVLGALLLVSLVTGSSLGMPFTGVLAAGYEVVFVWLRGATPGKRVLGLRVVPAGRTGPVEGFEGFEDHGDAGRAGVPLLASFFRWAVLGAWALLEGDSDPNTGGLFQLIGFAVVVAAVAMIATRPDRRGLHDLVGGTQVVRDGR